MSKVDISIAICNFNRADFLDRSIRSCLDQLLIGNKTLEILVIDDNSTDKSKKLLKLFKGKIRLFSNKKNKGIGYCSRLAVNKSRGKYFLRVDADDYISKFTCEIMSSILESNNNLAYVYSDHNRIDINGFSEKTIRLNTKKKVREHGAGVMFRTKMIKKIGNYNPQFRQAEDHDLILRLDKKFKSFYLPIPLYRYYIHGKNISLNVNNRNSFLKKIKKNASKNK